MSRTWLQKLETFVIVTTISVLVWLYADVQNITLYTGQQLAIRLVATGNGNLAVEPQVVRDIRLDVRATARQKFEFDRLRRTGPVEVRLDEVVDGGEPTRIVSTANLLQRSVLSDLGLAIEKVDPSDLTLRIEPLEEVELPVRVARGELDLVSEPAADPKRVAVTMPRSLAERIGEARVVADLSAIGMQNVQDGVAETRAVPLALDPQVRDWADSFQLDHTTIAPESVNVTFTLESQQRTYTLDRITVYQSLPASLTDQFTLTIPERMRFLSNIELAGPSHAIEQVASGQVAVHAEIRPTIEQLQTNVTTITPRLVNLPQGVYPTSPLPSVDVTVTPKQTQ